MRGLQLRDLLKNRANELGLPNEKWGKLKRKTDFSGEISHEFIQEKIAEFLSKGGLIKVLPKQGQKPDDKVLNNMCYIIPTQRGVSIL